LHFHPTSLTECKQRRYQKQIYDRNIGWAGYIKGAGAFTISGKSTGKETGIESVKSHRKPQARIEEEVGHFLRGTKKPAIYFQISGCGTESRKNLKAIYEEIEPCTQLERRCATPGLGWRHNYLYRD